MCDQGCSSVRSARLFPVKETGAGWRERNGQADGLLLSRWVGWLPREQRNGSPAFRCVYVAKFADMVVVLHSFVKTTNRSDRHAMQVAQERMKELKHELRKMGYRV
ncbi:type II toxin-antitoxin system RelE/ParE family toxin [Pseudomonas fakonensis]|uniref:type II toxin-antitoxin system RelE/ParE family toxin n=1 Tax=Pseudomonas fakonensis TaxID=2842355 RepID=UPI001CECD168|nr:type II toxin-antitoxin system RelE/ParE family toxin [Pseudomonas fakonensis]